MICNRYLDFSSRVIGYIDVLITWVIETKIITQSYTKKTLRTTEVVSLRSTEFMVDEPVELQSPIATGPQSLVC